MKQAQKMQAEMMKSQESLRTKILKRAPAAVL
jgi:DNA-binding protein YbaB